MTRRPNMPARSLGLKLLTALVLLVALAALWRQHQRQQPQALRHEGTTMGTIPYRLVAVPAPAGGPTDAGDALTRARDAIERVNQVMSTYLPASDLSRLNAAPAGQAVELDADLLAVLARARALADATDGAFDATGKPLFRLWKQAIQEGRLPDPAALADARAVMGWDKLTLSEAEAVKAVDGLAIDLGGIAKGHAVDRGLAELREAGLAGGLVDIGGDLAVFGPSPDGGPWRVAVQHPFDLDAYAGVLALRDRAVATSGTYRQFVYIDGQLFSHIIDPRTGAPTAHAPSVTVVGPDCLTADAWATALSVLGPAGLDRATQAGLEVLMVTGTPEQPQVHMTPGFQALLVPGTTLTLSPAPAATEP